MLADEQEADLLEKQLLHTSITIAPHLKPEAVSDRVEDANDVVRYTTKKREYSNASYESKTDRLRAAGMNMIKAWKQFSNSATMTAFTKLAKKKFQEVVSGVTQAFSK